MIMSSIPNKVLIFDWDDTICPSSFVDRCNVESYEHLTIEKKRLIDMLGECAAECLEAASQYGEVIIITNSDDGWVKYSAERYIPNLLQIIPKYRIVSSRTKYEHIYPGQPLCWKAAAFAHEVNEIFCLDGDYTSDSVDTSCESLVSTDDSSNEGGSAGDENSNIRMKKSSPSKHVISFGDSMEERTAVKIVAGQLSCIPKSVMFVSCPTPSELIGQLKMVRDYMKYVCEFSSSLDLEITLKQAQKFAEQYIKQNMPIQEKIPKAPISTRIRFPLFS